jgi:phage shock protein A
MSLLLGIRCAISQTCAITSRTTLNKTTYMSIFSRFRDIVTANLNSMLEKAEDPEKMIKLMIQEMEDTLIELKASCAGTMASRTRVQRSRHELADRAASWGDKARLALSKGREDLAREALLEKRQAEEEAASRDAEAVHLEQLVTQYQADILQLEEKLEAARKKHRLLVQRHQAASRRMDAQTQIRRATTSSAFTRFEQFEGRIDRMEADAELVNYANKSALSDEISKLEIDEDIEQELTKLKSELNPQSER